MRFIAHGPTRIALCALVTVLPMRMASAQSASPVSLQLSGTGLYFDGEIIPGAEAQLRWSTVRFSLGAGYQMFWDQGETANILFAEPRLVLGGNDAAALYLAGRVGSVIDTDGSSVGVVGGGGGLLFVLGRKTLLDLGAQFYTTFDGDDPILQLRVGLSFGF